MVTGPGDEMDAAAAGRGRMRASHADREHAIEVLKAAFVQDRLTKDELDLRVGRALAARTCADLAALTADIPVGPPAPARRRRRAVAPVAAGICLLIAAVGIAAMWVASSADPGGGDPSWTGLIVALTACAVWAAIGIMACAVIASWDERSSRRQLPPRPGPGGQALEAEQRGGAGPSPVPPGPRTDQTRADLRARKSPQHRRRIPARAGRAPRGVRPAPGAV